MKRHKLWILSVILIISLLLIAGCVSSPSSPASPEAPEGAEEPEGSDKEATMEPVELKLAHFWPANHFIETEVVKTWKEEVEKATDGLVTVTSYPGETLLGADAIYDGVAEGIVDLGISFFSYTRGRFPVIELLELPGISYNNAEAATEVIWEFIQKMNPKEIQDTKVMFAGSAGLAHLSTKAPVRTLEDLQGMENRTTGASALPMTALGGVPVSMPMSEAYESLSKGIVQGILGPASPLSTWKLAEVVDYVTITPFIYTATFFFTMNLDTWNSFPPDIQDAILDINEKIFKEKVVSLFENDDKAGLQYGIDQEGLEIIELSPEETDRWLDILNAVREENIAAAEEKGLPGNEAADLIVELADKYNEIYK